MSKREKRYACFACTTPYQLLGAISIVQGIGIEADLYLFGMFTDYIGVANRLKDYKIFKNIFHIDCANYRKPSFAKAMWQTMTYFYETKAFLPSNVEYEYFYSSSKAHPKMLLLYELKRRNPHIKFVLYEDGIGTYSLYSTTLNSSRKRLIADYFGGGKTFVPERTSVMVSSPVLMSFLGLPAEMKGIPVVQMPPLSLIPTNREMLKYIFNVADKDAIKERVIFFDLPRGAPGKITFDIEKVDNCLKDIADFFPYSELICKTHPRSTVSLNIETKIYSKQSVPMEVLYAEMTDIEERILIGNHTTALYSPKLLFDKEPYVISLHKIAWSEKPYIVKMFDAFKSLYRHQNRIIAPNNIMELNDYLKSIMTVL